MNASSGFLKRVLHEIFHRCLRRFTKVLSERQKIADPELKEKDGKNIGALFKTGTGQNEQDAVQ